MTISTKVKTTKLAKTPKTKVTIKKTPTTKQKKETIVETVNDIKNVLIYNNPIKEVKPEDRAPNVLDRDPEEHDAKLLTDIVEDFCEEGVLEEIEELLKDKGVFIAFSYEDYAKPEEITLSKLFSALAVQRPISKKHLRKIQENYNHLKVQTPIVLKIKYHGHWYYYIVDGQHTAATQGIRARMGLIKDIAKENWGEVKIRCSVVECANFTFAREIFLGINGEDKLELAYFDKWKNYVLGARQDNADNEFWKDCLELHEILEEFGIHPIHKDEPENIKRMAGAFVDVHLIEDKTPEEVRWIARLHQMLWDDKPMDSFEVDPMLLLRSKFRKDSSLDNRYVYSFVKELGSLIRHTAGSPSGWKKYTQKTYPLWFKSTHPDEADKKISIPDDASLALLLFAYQAAGGQFKDLRLTFLKEKFTKRGETLFDYLSIDGKEVNEDLKATIKGSKDFE
jgi:hypothetical protein